MTYKQATIYLYDRTSNRNTVSLSTTQYNITGTAPYQRQNLEIDKELHSKCTLTPYKF